MTSFVQKQNLLSLSVKLRNKQILSHLDIELTERCNNRCIHCYINQPEHAPDLQSREMNTDQVKNILQQAADLGCLSVRFTGGEPLLRVDFSELYQFARRLGLRVRLFTNARLITPDLAALFARMPPGQPIEVSVYGMQTASYDAVAATRGAFDEFWQGIQSLQAFKIPLVIKSSLLPQNRDELPELEAFAATLPHMHHRPGYTMNFDLRARRDDPTKNRFIKSLRITPEETLAMLTREPDKYVDDMRQFAAKFMRPSGDQLFACGAGLGTCVDAYGSAQMCMLLRHPETVYPLDPDLHRKNHLESDLSPLAYAIQVFFPQIRQMRSSNPAYLKRCGICFLKGLCEQCPAKSWEEHGTLDTPVEYLCAVAHAQARYLGLLNAGEHSWELPLDVWRARLEVFTQPISE
jgi:MoaA/NifB/PqqE/SkfB family radical SAM enzyme